MKRRRSSARRGGAGELVAAATARSSGLLNDPLVVYALIFGALLAAVGVAFGGELQYYEVGTVWTGAGEPSSPGGVLVRDGKILHVGAPLKVPEKAKSIVLPKATLMPAFIDAQTYLGIKKESDRNERLKPIYPEFKITDSMNGQVLSGGTLYEEAVLTAYVSPGARTLVPGTGAVIDLGTRRVRPGLLTLSLSSDALYGDRAPTARSGMAFLLREEVPAAVAGRKVLRIFARRPDEVEMALSFAKKNGVAPILVGPERPDLLPAYGDLEGVVVVPPSTFDPKRLGRLAAASEKGVRFAFASWAANEWHVNVRFLASVAHAYGMKREAALRALTVHAAEACGVPEAGTITVGGPADFVVFGGDPLDLTAPLQYVVADGKVRYTSEGGGKP